MLTIDGVRLDDPTYVYVIAELSGNHGQSYAQAERLVAAAAEAGAQAVKVQTFTAAEICADVPLLFGYDAAHDAWCKQHGATRLRDLMSKGGFPRQWHKPLQTFAASCGLTFLSTPFSVDAAKFLVEDIGVPALKIASGDLTFQALIQYAATTGLPTILSTGGARLAEIVEALAWFDESVPLGGEPGWCNVAVLQCVSAYPCPETAANLLVVDAFRECLLCASVGFSDHTVSVETIPAMAVTLGARIYEKHLKLEDDTTSIDAAHSLTPSQFKAMVKVIRSVPSILGHGRKEPHALEMHDRTWARRGRDGLRPTDEARAGRWC